MVITAIRLVNKEKSGDSLKRTEIQGHMWIQIAFVSSARCFSNRLSNFDSLPAVAG